MYLITLVQQLNNLCVYSISIYSYNGSHTHSSINNRNYFNNSEFHNNTNTTNNYIVNHLSVKLYIYCSGMCALEEHLILLYFAGLCFCSCLLHVFSICVAVCISCLMKGILSLNIYIFVSEEGRLWLRPVEGSISWSAREFRQSYRDKESTSDKNKSLLCFLFIVSMWADNDSHEVLDLCLQLKMVGFIFLMQLRQSQCSWTPSWCFYN